MIGLRVARRRCRPAHRRPLSELVAEARAELNVNPTITVYDIGPDGQEYRRRPANPFARLTFAFSQMVDAAMRFQPRFETLSAAIEKNRVWR